MNVTVFCQESLSMTGIRMFSLCLRRIQLHIQSPSYL